MNTPGIWSYNHNREGVQILLPSIWPSCNYHHYSKTTAGRWAGERLCTGNCGMRWYALRIRCLIFSHSYALASYVANNRASPCSSSIYAVLFDGRTFEFFSFNGKTAQPTFSRGVFCLPNADLIKVLATKFYGNHTDAEFIFSLDRKSVV